MMTKDDGNWSIDLEIFHLNSFDNENRIEVGVDNKSKRSSMDTFYWELATIVCRGVARNISRGVPISRGRF